MADTSSPSLPDTLAKVRAAWVQHVERVAPSGDVVVTYVGAAKPGS